MAVTVISTTQNRQIEVDGVRYTLPWNQEVTLPVEAIPALLGLDGVVLSEELPAPTPAAAVNPAPQKKEE